MSFRDFLLEKYPEKITAESDEPISCPNIQDFLDYIKDTNIPDISGIDFPEDQEIVVESRVFALFTAENVNYNGGITLRFVTVMGDISFGGSWVEKTFCLQNIKCTNLVLPENVENSTTTLSGISATGTVTIPERA